MTDNDSLQPHADKFREIMELIDLTPEVESVPVLIGVFYVTDLLPRSVIENWLDCIGQEQSAKFLETELIKQGVERTSAVLTCSRIHNLDADKLKSIVTIILDEAFQKIDLAGGLLTELQDKGHGQGGIVTSQIAELAYQISTKGKTTTSALCMGLFADRFALQASQHLPVTYELPGVGVGRTIRDQIFSIAGTAITFTELPLSVQREYDSGFLANSWNIKTPKLRISDSLSSDFEYVAPEISNLQQMMKTVHGRIVCLIPLGWLYKTVAQDLKFKQYLIKNGYVEAVIQLPPAILPNTGIPSALVVINTVDKKEEIQFINAGDDRFVEVVSRNQRCLSNHNVIVSLFGSNEASKISQYVSNEAVLSNTCNLDAKRYVQSNKLEDLLQRYPEQCMLSDIAEVIRCQAIKSDASGSVDYKEITPANIDCYGMLNNSNDYKGITPSSKDISRAKTQRLKAKDIIFTIKGALGKCALVQDEQVGFIAGQSFVILRLKQNSPISEIELFRFLYSGSVQEWIEQFASAASVKIIKMQDLKKLPVPIPSKEQQVALRESHNEIVNLINHKRSIERDIDQSIESFWS